MISVEPFPTRKFSGENLCESEQWGESLPGGEKWSASSLFEFLALGVGVGGEVHALHGQPKLPAAGRWG